MDNGVILLLSIVVAILVPGIGLSIANKDGGIAAIAIIAALAVLFFGYMFLTI